MVTFTFTFTIFTKSLKQLHRVN